MRHDTWSDGFRQSTRGQIVEALRPGQATVGQLAEHLGLTDNAVRSQLQVLMGDGLVRKAGVRRVDAAGKPATWYELAPETDIMFSQAYLPILEVILDALDHQLGPKARDNLTRDAALALARQLGPSLPADATAEQRAEQVIETLGGRVDVMPTDEGVALQGLGCPLSMLTPQHPEICTIVQQVLAEVCGRQVREACDRGDRPRCRFVVTKTPTTPGSPPN